MAQSLNNGIKLRKLLLNPRALSYNENMKPAHRDAGHEEEDPHVRIAEHPLIKRISELAANMTSSRLVVVTPGDEGWKEIRPQSPINMPEFCRTIQSTAEGARNCRMCHVLMSVAACTEGLTEQQCHAGARVLVAPAATGSSGSMAVLSSCIFHGCDGIKTVRARAKALNIAVSKLEKAYRALPSLSTREHEALRNILEICASAAKEIQTNIDLAAETRRLAATKGPTRPSLTASIEARLRAGSSSGRADAEAGQRDRSSSSLIRVLTQIIDERPHLPFTEKELAVAARITPNHLSLLFHRHTGKCFSDYLAERRIELAKRLLADLTLSISDVARRVGYNDPGYFARRFRSKTGMTPRRWRETA